MVIVLVIVVVLGVDSPLQNNPLKKDNLMAAFVVRLNLNIIKLNNLLCLSFSLRDFCKNRLQNNNPQHSPSASHAKSAEADKSLVLKDLMCGSFSAQHNLRFIVRSRQSFSLFFFFFKANIMCRAVIVGEYIFKCNY